MAKLTESQLADVIKTGWMNSVKAVNDAIDGSGSGGSTATKQSIGLGNVDNTSDIDKPISTAVASALSNKANSSSLATKADSSFVTTQLALKSNRSYTNPLRTVAYFGDSRTAQNESTSSLTVPAPLARSQMWWMQTLSYGRLLRNHLYNFGVSGDSIADVKNRVLNDVANAYGTKPSDAGYSMAVLLCGTNSVTSLIDFNTMTSDFLLTANYLKDTLGKRVAIIAEWPRGYGTTPGTTAYLTTEQAKLMYRYARFLRDLRSNPDFTIIDVWPDAADPTGTNANPKALMMNTDGLHNSPGIAYITGKKLATELSKFVNPANYTPSSNGDLWDATGNPYGCINTNPMLRGTTGTLSTGGTGVSPTGYTLSSSGGVTVVGSQTTMSGRDCYKMVISGTTTSTNAYVRLRLSGIQSSVSPGDVLIAGYEYAVDASGVNFSAPTVMIDPNVAADRVYGGLSFGGDNQIPPSVVEAHSGVALSADYTVPATVPASLSVEFRPMFTATGVASSITIYIFSAFICKK